MADDPLDDFERDEFTAAGYTRTVFRKGTGPGVVVVHEIPGVTPRVADFARRVVDRGFTVAMPSLVGTPGKRFSQAYALQSMAKACVAKEFTVFASGRTSPIVAFLRELAADLHERAGGPGVGAVGMCLTGNFALGMMVDDRMLAPVLSQPSLPIGFGSRHHADVAVSPADRRALVERDDGCPVLGLRFTNDRIVRAERFETLRSLLGDRFIGVEIDSSRGNPHGIRSMAHSVLTEDFVDEPGHPTHDALGRVLDFFSERLGTA